MPSKRETGSWGQRCISVSGRTYRRLREYADRNRTPMAQLVETLTAAEAKVGQALLDAR
jgi:hypothetical protein